VRKLLLCVVAVGVAWLIYTEANQPAWEPPPAFTAYMEKTRREVDGELAGPRGDEARRICMRVAGVSFPARTSIELIRAGYTSDTAIKYADCIVNYLHPVPAEKRR